MKASELKVGDKIKILSVPGEGIPNYYIDKDTVRVYKKIIARKRPVRIYEIQDGQPWYAVKFRRKNGKWEYHFLSVMDEDANWVPVKRKQ